MARGRIAFVALAVTALAAWAGHVRAADAPPAPGERLRISPVDLPAVTPSVVLLSRREPRPAEVAPTVPRGFAVSLFADHVADPRVLAVAPDGAVFVASSSSGRILVFHPEADGAGGSPRSFAGGFARPFGLAVRDGAVYVADIEGVWRMAYQPDGGAGPRRRLTPPGALGNARDHWTRSLAFAPDGSRFYVGVGSSENLGIDPAPHATIQSFAADGRPLGTVASGLRTPDGLAVRPDGTLYVVVNERDGMGDDLVPDYFTRVVPGAFYGWPYAYIGPHPQPGYGDRRPDLVAATRVPDLLFQAHSAPLGLAFYDAGQFPPDYRGDAFVTLHGSWNRSSPAGFFVARIHMNGGRPADGSYSVFMAGFRLPAGVNTVWGRPTGIAVARDGSLLVSDDAGGTIWRVRYVGK